MTVDGIWRPKRADQFDRWPGGIFTTVDNDDRPAAESERRLADHDLIEGVVSGRVGVARGGGSA